MAKGGIKMKISFDLDGVITHSSKWFFRMLNLIREINPCSLQLQRAEIDYYSSLQLNLNPNLFLAKDDIGVIITCRRPFAKQVTEDWLAKFGIRLPVIFVDNGVDWSNYYAGSMVASKLKALAIKKLSVDIHFDNNPYLVRELRLLLPTVKVICIGAEDDYEVEVCKS